MAKRFISFFLILTIFFSSVPVPLFATESEPVKNFDRVESIQNLQKLSGGKLKLRKKNGQVFLSGKLSGRQSAGEKSAIKFLEENKFIFGIDSTANELKVVKVNKDDIGHTYVKFVQVINGIKVDGSMLNVHFDENGVVVSVNGNLEENKKISVMGNKKISENDAISIAKKQYTNKKLRNVPKAEKLIVSKDKKNYEVFKVNISYTKPDIGNYDVFVESTSGEIIRTESRVRYEGPTTGSGIDVAGNIRDLNLYQAASSYQMKDVTKSATGNILTYSADNGTEYGTLVSNNTNHFGSETHKASVSAHYYAGKVIDFYKNLFNRNSLDDYGMDVESFTHYGYKVNNAFWDGYEMVYGDGDGEQFTYMSGDLDVVGHEMTHGVISYTADLNYNNQSGALNESMADVFGVFISTYDKYNVARGGSWTFNIADWVIGDDIYTPNVPGDALRSLANPTLYDQPDNMSDYGVYPDTEAGDWGGIHINSGIPNKAAFLVAQNIGMEKTARIYYRALVNYMTSYTDFEEARYSLEQAATDLHGETSTEVTAIKNAFNSVGIGQSSTTNDPYEPNDSMESAYSINIGTAYQSYIATSVDVDYYKLNISDTGPIRLELKELPYDYDLYLYNSSGALIADSVNSSTQSEVINFDADQTGSYYIKVFAYSNFSTTQMYSLIVTKPVTGVTLDKSSGNLKVGETLALAATVSPNDASNKELTWASSDTSVATVNSTGKVTAVSNGTATITVTTSDGGYIATCTVTVYGVPTPTSVKAVSSSYKSIKISWGAVAGASGYEVHRATSGTGTYYLLATTTTNYYSNINLRTNQTYYYKLRAYRMVGTSKVYSSFSSVVSAKPIPSTPTSLNAVITSNSSIRTSWGAVAGASGYEVHRADSSTGTYSRIATTTATSYNNTRLNTTKTYYYKVRAYRMVGTTKVHSSYSTVIIVPGRPASVRAVSSSYNSIRATWGAVAGARGYEVYRATSSNGNYSLISSTTSTRFINTGLTTNKTYYYKVRAYSLVGTRKIYGKFSIIVGVKPVMSVPASLKAASFSYNSIKTSWSTVTGASGYEVYRATSSTGTYYLVKRTTSARFINSGLITNKTYYYKVRAYRMVGTSKVYSRFSTIVKAKPIPSMPTPTATATSATSIKISWGAVAGASGYQVYRATSRTGSYSVVKTTASTSFINTGLTTNKGYYYKVRAYRTVGATRVYSSFSAIVSAIPRPLSPKFAVSLPFSTNSSAYFVGFILKNYGTKTLTIYSDNAELKDDNYYTYDRDLQLVNENGDDISSIQIPASGTSYVFFRVKDSPTWYDMYTRLYYEFTYDSARYIAVSSYYYGNYYWNK